MTSQHISSHIQTMNELMLSDACAFVSIVVSDSDIHSSLSSALAASVSMITFYTNTEYLAFRMLFHSIGARVLNV